MTSPVIVQDPSILSGAPVFAGTRVMAQTLWDYLEAGDSLESFLEDFPSVSREQVLGYLAAARERMMAAS